MARTKISEFSSTAADNTDIDGIDIAEGCAPSGINNAIRTLMADLKDMQTGASGDTFTFASLNATTANIDGGTIDGATIGGSSAAPVSSTSLAYTGTLTGGTGVINIGSGQVYKDASGNVGIGTSSPASKLDVKGITRLGGNSQVIATYEDGTGVSIEGIDPSNASTKKNIWLNAYGGRVGIGTAAPSGKVEISDSSLNVFLTNTDSASFATTNIVFRNTSANTNIGYIKSQRDGTTSGGYLIFNTTTQAGLDTERMRIDSSGNVGIGTSSPGARLNVFGSDATGFVGIAAQNSNFNTGIAGIEFGSDPTYKKAAIGLVRSAANGVGSIVFFNDSNTDAANWSGGDEKMRLDSSGNLLVAQTSDSINAKVGIASSSNSLHVVTTASSGSVAGSFERNNAGILINFRHSGADISGAYIYNNTTSVSYATGSDYRLKENIQPMTGALAVVQQLKPCTYTWKADGSDGQGFIAHELQAVVPDAVTGEKDAVDKDGNPVYQGVDTSFLVATLTAAIQEQQAIIKSLQDRITLLEQA